MKKLSSLLLITLLFVSFQSIANRPAEDDSSSALPTPEPETEVSSNIPMPENANQETVSEDQPANTLETESLQTGDTIQLRDTASKPEIIIIDFPKRGMDMSKVLNELGEPTIRHPAIGKPPITRWVYPDRTVFFEYSHVIHVVAK